MIHITEHPKGLEIVGHAGYAPVGSDIVCAGITALADTLVMSLQQLTEDLIIVADGSGIIKVRYKELSEAGRLLISAFFIGATWIAEEYPEHVTVSRLE